MKKILLTFLSFSLLFLSLLLLFYFTSTDFTQAQSLASRLGGQIVLQVEQNGEAWYINPSDEKRYYMGRPQDAFDLMRSLGVGITTNNLSKIQVAESNFGGDDSDGDGLSDMIEDSFGTNKNNKDTDGDGFSDKDEILSGYSPLKSKIKLVETNFVNKYLGKIFLQVEANGEAWYIYPKNSKRYFLGRPADAFEIMRSLGLGITDENLETIKIGETSTLPPDNNGGDNPQAQSAYCSMYHCDYGLTGRSNFTGPTSPVEIKWKYEVAERVINLQPSIDEEGNIHWGTWGNVDPGIIDDLDNLETSSSETKDRARGKFYTNSPDGKLLWSYDPGPLAEHYLGTVETTPAIASNGTLYYGRGDGILYAINSDGSLKWEYKTLENTHGRGQIISSPIIGPDGTIYFGTQAYLQLLGYGYHIFYAVIDKGDHAELKWRYPEDDNLGSYVSSMASIASDGTVYFAAGAKFYALDSGGDLKWKYTGQSTLGSAAIGSDGTLYIHSTNTLKEASEIYALNSNGSLKWRYDVGFQTSTIPAIGENGIIYFTAGNPRDNHSNLSLTEAIKTGKLYALEDCGQDCVNTKWTFTLSGSAGSRPAVIDSKGIIYVSSRGSDEIEPPIPAKIWALKDKGNTSELLWDFEVPEGEIWGGYPVIGPNNTLVFGTAVCTDYKICNESTDIPKIYMIGEK